MLYLDDVPSVEVGVEVAEPFTGLGRVVGSSLPAGRVATATLRGPYEVIGAAHEAVIRGVRRSAACSGSARGGRCTATGTRPRPQPEVEIFYLVA